MNMKISQRMSGVPKRDEEGAQQGSKALLREKGEHLPVTSGQQKGKERSRVEAGKLRRGWWGEREVSKGQAENTRVPVCVLAAERGTTKLCTHQAKPWSCQRSWRCVQPAELSLKASAGFDKAGKKRKEQRKEKKKEGKSCNAPFSDFAVFMF